MLAEQFPSYHPARLGEQLPSYHPTRLAEQVPAAPRDPRGDESGDPLPLLPRLDLDFPGRQGRRAGRGALEGELLAFHP